MSAPGPRIMCVIPVKGFARAKSRLSTVLGPGAREQFARRMFEHVLQSCTLDPAIAGVWVATDDDLVATLASERGAQVLRDVDQGSLGEVIDRAFARLAELRASHGIAIMSDLPRLGGADLSAVVAASEAHDMVIAPDRARLGTNLLALRLDRVLPTCFGRPDSFAAHQQAAQSHGLDAVVVERPGLAFDVDSADDYRELSRP